MRKLLVCFFGLIIFHQIALAQIPRPSGGSSVGTSNLVITSGAGDPIANCNAPSTASIAVYFDTSGLALWYCKSTNSWQRILDTTNVGPFELLGVVDDPDTTWDTPAANRFSCRVRSNNLFSCKDDTGTITTIGAMSETGVTFTDITTSNSSTTKHGFMPKLNGKDQYVFKGDGTQGTNGVAYPFRRLIENFNPHAVSTTALAPYGDLGWVLYNGGSVTTQTTFASGLLIKTGAASSINSGIALASINQGYNSIPRIDNASFDFLFVGQLTIPGAGNILAGKWRMGVYAPTDSNGNTSLVGCEYDPALNANWRFVITTTLAAATYVDTGVAANSSDVVACRIRSTTNGVALFSFAVNGADLSTEVTGGTGQTLNSALPTATKLMPLFYVGSTGAAEDKWFRVIYWEGLVPIK